MSKSVSSSITHKKTQTIDTPPYVPSPQPLPVNNADIPSTTPDVGDILSGDEANVGIEPSTVGNEVYLCSCCNNTKCIIM